MLSERERERERAHLVQRIIVAEKDDKGAYERRNVFRHMCFVSAEPANATYENRSGAAGTSALRTKSAVVHSRRDATHFGGALSQ